MSISAIKSCQLTTCPIEPTQEDPSKVGYHLVKTNINFLKKSFGNEGWTMKAAAPTPINIHSYFDVKELTEKFKFPKNGFEYRELEKESSLLSTIQQYAQDRRIHGYSTDETQLKLEAEQYSTIWGKENGILGTPVVLDVLYRDSQEGNGEENPFHFVHVDYCKENIEDPFSYEGEAYKKRIENKFSPMSNEEYEKNVIPRGHVKMWIAIHDGESDSGLGVFNIEAIKDLNEKLQPIYINRTRSFSLHPDPDLEIITKHEQTLADRLVLLFNPTLTPHTALQIEGGHRATRRSIELTIVFVEKTN